jgi:large subunit ribosomal protein L28
MLQSSGWFSRAIRALTGSVKIMAKVCSICGKGPIVRNKLVQSGKPKREGGVGRKTTGITKTWKYPNLQKVKVWREGHARSMRVCTSCIRQGKTLVA